MILSQKVRSSFVLVFWCTLHLRVAVTLGSYCSSSHCHLQNMSAGDITILKHCPFLLCVCEHRCAPAKASSQGSVDSSQGSTFSFYSGPSQGFKCLTWLSPGISSGRQFCKGDLQTLLHDPVTGTVTLPAPPWGCLLAALFSIEESVIQNKGRMEVLCSHT